MSSHSEKNEPEQKLPKSAQLAAEVMFGLMIVALGACLLGLVVVFILIPIWSHV